VPVFDLQGQFCEGAATCGSHMAAAVLHHKQLTRDGCPTHWSWQTAERN